MFHACSNVFDQNCHQDLFLKMEMLRKKCLLFFWRVFILPTRFIQKCAVKMFRYCSTFCRQNAGNVLQVLKMLWKCFAPLQVCLIQMFLYFSNAIHQNCHQEICCWYYRNGTKCWLLLKSLHPVDMHSINNVPRACFGMAACMKFYSEHFLNICGLHFILWNMRKACWKVL